MALLSDRIIKQSRRRRKISTMDPQDGPKEQDCPALFLINNALKQIEDLLQGLQQESSFRLLQSYAENQLVQLVGLLVNDISCIEGNHRSSRSRAFVDQNTRQRSTISRSPGCSTVVTTAPKVCQCGEKDPVFLQKIRLRLHIQRQTQGQT